MNETLTLAQAIREGAKLHPQCFGRLVKDVEGEYHTCALGAAYEARLGMLPPIVDSSLYDDSESAYGQLKERFPELDAKVLYPIANHCWNLPTVVHPTLEAAILELNDEECWTREQIADWVEGLNLHAGA